MDKPKVVIFDMDLIAYRAAAAAEKRSVEVTHIKTGKVKSFKHRTEFKEFLSSKGFEYKELDYKIKDIQTAEPEEHAFQIVKSQVNSILQGLEADRVEGWIGGKDNFRLKLDLPEIYKGNRADMLRPIHLDATKKYITNKYPGGLVQGKEVDDHVVIRFHELDKAGNEVVIATFDKDQKGCIGTAYFDWTQAQSKTVKVPPFGILFWDNEKKKIDGLGLNFYCYQLLKGDPSDGYTPSDLHKFKFGDQSVLKLLKDCKDVNELFTVTENQFKKWFPESFTYKTHDGREVQKDYKEVIQLYHSCVYMHRIKDDPTTFYDLWEEFK